MVNELVISNISDYVQKVCETHSALIDTKFIRDFVLLFRGQANKNYPLIPSIGRNRRFTTQKTIFNEERNLIEMAKYKLPDIFTNTLTPIELLALLQHHGIPTRLLDVTENALVALYFACCSSFNADGEIIVFKSDNTDVANYPVVNAIADSYHFTRGTWTHLEHFYGDVKTQPYFLEQQQQNEICNKDNASGGQWIAECCQRIFYIYAPTRSMRQQMQHGRYILFPNAIEQIGGINCFTWKINPIPKNHKDICLRFIVPYNIKQQLLCDLSVLGIREDILFCDNIDIVCKGIVDSFSKRS